jgi:hypothetical protein
MCSRVQLGKGSLAGIIIGSLAGIGLVAGILLMLSRSTCTLRRETGSGHAMLHQGKDSISDRSVIHTLSDTLVGDIVVNDNGIIMTMVPGQTVFHRRSSVDHAVV